MWKKAVNAGFFAIWPGQTENVIKKHLQRSSATIKGHLKRTRKNVRSVQPKENNQQEEPLMEKITEHTSLVVIKIMPPNGATGKGYADLTGQFPVNFF
eukprot:11648364-Ditylum_brightwellii.AAC.1